MLRLRNFLLFLLFATHAMAFESYTVPIRGSNFDIDDNIIYSTARIYLWDSTRQKEEGVSTEEWSIVENQLGKPGKHINSVTRSESFREFEDTGIRGEGEFKYQIEQMIKSGNTNWKGPSWEALVAALSDPAMRDHVTFITARQHSPRAIMAGFQVLYEHGLIPALPRIENIFTIGWKGLDPKYRAESTAASKAKVMLDLLDRIEARPIPPGTNHTWGFSDDDFDNFEKAREVLVGEVASGKWPHVKVVLFYTGRNHPTEKAHAVVIERDGFLRLATSAEMPAFTKAMFCRSFFAY